MVIGSCADGPLRAGIKLLCQSIDGLQLFAHICAKVSNSGAYINKEFISRVNNDLNAFKESTEMKLLTKDGSSHGIDLMF